MDPVNPTHYAFDEGVIECIDYIESHAFDFVEGNVIKYVTRYQHKNGTEDLKKARWYLDRLIKRSEEWDKKYKKSRYDAYQALVETYEQDEFSEGQKLDASSGPVNQS
jgi:hypothetical protein